MPFLEKDGLKYFAFSNFQADKVLHAIFTRHGGVSPSPWAFLNVGGTVGDERSRVIENRLRCFRAVNLDPRSMFDVWQVHSADVVIANAPHNFLPPEFKADAIITDNPEVTLYMRFADCTPILLHDPVKAVVGIVHAGWMGTVKHVTVAAVNAMIAAYGCDPRHIRAGIGPSIGPDHYEIGRDVIERVRETFPDQADDVLVVDGERIHFDLWRANQIQLQQTGVQHIEISRLCTACNTDDWFSHRGEKGKTGRFGALIALKG